MQAVIVHPRMSAMAGGERVAVHVIRTLLRSGYKVALISEKFDTKLFEQLPGCEGLFEQVQQLTYPEFEPFFSRALLYQRALYTGQD